MRKYVDIIVILLWFYLLRQTDSYYLPYVIIGILGFYSYLKNKNKVGKLETVFSVLYGIMIYLANYNLFWNNTLTRQSNILNISFGIFKTIIFLYSSYVLFSNLLSYLFDYFKKIKSKKENNKISSFKIFICSFILLTIVDLIVLILIKYPGNISPDGINQIGQIKSGVFSNHHPYIHTMLISLFVSHINNINFGLFLYNVFQIIIFNLCISYSIVSLYKLGINNRVRKYVYLWYLCMPFNILFSITVWKDTIFASFLLLLVVCLYNILKNNCKKIDYILYGISSFVVCTFRSNGIIAFVIGVILFLIIYRKKHLIISIISIVIIIVSFLFTHPFLNYLGVAKADSVEVLSIPINQISRVVVDSNLTKSEEKLLSKIVDLDKVKEEYLPYISDPVKNLIREKGNIKYFEKHKKDYLKLYLKLLVKHPKEYIFAYSDLTKGYYNSGYSYWVWYGIVFDNDYGIVRDEKIHVASLGLSGYCFLFENISFLQLFISIGLYVWIGIFLLFYNIKKKHSEELVLLFIPVGVIITLLIATPVFSEFRYAYPFILTLPFILVVSLNNIKNKKVKM